MMLHRWRLHATTNPGHCRRADASRWRDPKRPLVQQPPRILLGTMHALKQEPQRPFAHAEQLLRHAVVPLLSIVKVGEHGCSLGTSGSAALAQGRATASTPSDLAPAPKLAAGTSSCRTCSPMEAARLRARSARRPLMRGDGSRCSRGSPGRGAAPVHDNAAADSANAACCTCQRCQTQACIGAHPTY